MMKQHPKNKGQDDKQYEWRRNKCVGNSPNSKLSVLGRKVGNGLIAEDNVREPSEERERPDGYRQGGEAEPDDEKAVQRSAQSAHYQANDDRQRHREFVLPKQPKQGTRKAQHRGNREVDLVGDHDQA